jgi:hypothetical protein
MSWFPFRAVTSRRTRPTAPLGTAARPGRARGQQRHPAMSGLDVPPVHGWHCICDRCAAQTRKAG